MGQGAGAGRGTLTAALCLFAVSVAVAADPVVPNTPPSAPAAAASELRYRLQAADGLPGAVRVVFVPDRAGPFHVEAAWTGRGLAGLWIDAPGGRTIGRAVGASPLALDGTVDGQSLRPGDRLVIRFAPTMAKGVLAGELRVVTGPPAAEARPAATAPGNVRAEAGASAAVAVTSEPPATVPAAFKGPGACLGPVFEDDPPGRALRAFAASLEQAPAPVVEWARRWSAAVVKAAAETERGNASRGALDRLWDDLDASSRPEADAAFRQVLAALEDLTRRGLSGRAGADAARERRDAVVSRIGCLSR